MTAKNRVKFTTATTGTGAITVGSASSGFRTPADAGMADGEVFSYAIEDGSAWEVGRGTYSTTGPSFTRSVLQSSNSDAAINLSGSAVVRVTMLGEDVHGWKLLVNESGASIANWTSVSGTWSSDGTVIKQTDTSNSFRMLKYNNKVPTAAMVMQADIKIITSGASKLGYINFAMDGAINQAPTIRLNQGGTVDMELLGAVLRNQYSWTINASTWYTLKVLYYGGVATVWVDGVRVGSAGQMNANPNASFIGLGSYGAEVHFRNIKMYEQVLPV